MSERFKTPPPATVTVGLMIEIEKTSEFMQTHARLLDRRRFDLLFGNGDPDAAVAALSAYRNPDGGFGWGLEPDLRAPSSQPAGALHAFEVLEEITPATSPFSAQLCDWLQSVTLEDGGLPFALEGAAGPGSAPFWAGADHRRSSLHITSAVCGMAHRVASHDPAVAGHAWLARATDFCLRQIADYERSPHAIELLYVLQFLDAVQEQRGEALSELERVAAFVPASGAMPVSGGAEEEQIRPLQFSPRAGGPLRQLFDAGVIAADRERLAGERLEDGGWDVDFKSYSPAAALEWRGYATVRAVAILTEALR
jgi:hypothetical protein